MRTVLRENGLWQYLDRSGGLPNGDGVDVFLHRETGLWMLVDGKIHHLDGERLVSYPGGLAADQKQRNPFMTRDGRIWIPTNKDQLFCFDGHKCSRAHSPFVEDLHFHRMHPYGESGLYLRLHNGLHVFDGNSTRTFRAADGCPPEDGESCEGANGTIWLMVKEGICRFDGTSFKSFKAPKDIPWDAWAVCVASKVTEDVWMEADDSLIHFDGKRFHHEKLQPGIFSARTISPKYVDSHGCVWCLSYPSLCIRRNPDGTFTHWSASDGLLTDYPRRILGEDVEGCLWFYCGSGGVCRYDSHSAAVISSDHVHEALIRDRNGALWWGRGHDLVRCENDKPVTAASGDHILDIASDRQGRVWLACYGGVSRLEQNGTSARLAEYEPETTSRAVIEAADGTVWFSLRNSLMRFKEGEITEFTEKQTGLNSVYCIAELQDGSLLLGNMRGGGVRRFDGYVSTPFEPLADPRMDKVRCITVGPGNSFWAGTMNGVGHYDGRELHFYDERDGVCGEVARVFVDSRGHVWIATRGGGLVRFDGRNFQVLSQDDILPSNGVVGVVEEKDGSFVIATYGGVCRFRPNYETRPTVQVARVLADRPYENPTEIEYSESVPRVTITFGGETFKSVPLRYTYKLEGFDTGWRRSMSNTVVYEHLPPGDYELRVRSIDRDLVYSERTAVLRIKVAPDIRDRAITQLRAEVEEKANALQDARSFAASILNSINDAIVVINTDGMILAVNRGTLNLLGYDETGLIGEHIRSLLPERHRQFMGQAGIARIIDEGSVSNMERAYLAKSGEEIPVLFSASCIRDGKGDVLNVVTVASDIREHKHLQHRLQASQKMESLGVLAGGIAHDFNNLLVGMMGNADIIFEELGANSPVKEETQDIIQAAQQAAKLCREMLAYAGRGAYVLTKIDVSDTVKQIVPLLRASASKKVNFDLQLDPELPRVEGDEAQISQVVMNLIANAAEAIGDSTGTVTVKTSVAEHSRESLASPYFPDAPDPGLYVCLEVTDDGCGVDPNVRDRILEPFASTKFKGRGLGLAAVHGILRGHGGTLQLESEVGKGSTFRIYLPAADDSADEPPAPKPAVQKRVSYSGTVLVADDEVPVRSLLQRMLRRIGFDVVLAVNGRECVELFRKHAGGIRLVLLDMTMPELDGCQTLDEIRKLDANVPVIMSSGYTEKDITGRFDPAKAPGAFVQKPYRQASLLEAIEKVLES